MAQNSCKPNRNSSRIIVAGAGKITSLDPAQASTFHALQLISSLGDPLYKLDLKGTLQPKLASGPPKISEDGLTVLIPIRKNVLFHDGSSFDAEAMAFSLKRFIRIGTLNYILNGRIAAIETPNKFLLQLTLTRPSTSILNLLTSINITPISPTSYSNYKNKFLNNKFVGTGPYKLTNFSSQHQKLEPFEGYWGTPASNQGIDFIHLSNSTALFSALRTGEIDVLLSTSLDEDHRRSLKIMTTQGKLKEGKGSALEIGYITFNTKTPPLNNSNLRKALLYTIDRKLITQRVSFGLRKSLRSLVPSSLNKRANTLWPKYNPKKARDLMKKAGYCNNQKLSLSFTFRSNVPADKLLALTWQSQIKRDLHDCMNLRLNGIESTTIYRQLGEGAFQVVMLDWRGAYPDPEAYLVPLLSCSKITNTHCEEGEAAASGSFWSSNWIEKALKRSDLLTGQARMNTYQQIENRAVDGGAYLPIWLDEPRAWSQNHISKPQFDGSGQLLLDHLRKLN